MNREDLLDAVSHPAGTESTDAAERATLATLRTLGERVTAGETDGLAAELPGDPAAAVTDRGDETPEAFSVEEFVERVIEREGVDGLDRAAATRHFRADMAALADAGHQRERQEACKQLPNNFAALFEPDDRAVEVV